MPCRAPILSLGQFPVVYHLFLLLIDPSNSLFKNKKNNPNTLSVRFKINILSMCWIINWLGTITLSVASFPKQTGNYFKLIKENDICENVGFLQKPANQAASIEIGHLPTCMKLSKSRNRKTLYVHETYKRVLVSKIGLNYFKRASNVTFFAKNNSRSTINNRDNPVRLLLQWLLVCWMLANTS